MPMPENSADADRFVAIVTYRVDETIERKAFTYECTNSLKEMFEDLFHKGRIGFMHSDLPISIEISPDPTRLSRPKIVLEELEERHKEVSF